MKRFLTLALAVLLSLGLASATWAQTGGAAPSATPAKKAKKHQKKKHHKKSQEAPVAPAPQ